MKLAHLLKDLPRVERPILMVRHGQCQANVIGSILGQQNSVLTIEGRKQASTLFPAFFLNKHILTNKPLCSDLSRARDTLSIALGFPTQNEYLLERRLRQLDFGRDEGLNFDSLPDQHKQRINSMQYAAPGGQTWMQVALRAMQVVKQLPKGPNLLFTHGGLMCTQTWNIGLKDVVPNCSVICLQYDVKGQPSKLHWTWEYDQQSIQ